MRSPLLTSEKIASIKHRTIGVTCKGACKGFGSIFSNGVFNDCSCIHSFNELLLYTGADIPQKYHKFDLRNLMKSFIDTNQIALQIIKGYTRKINEMVKDGVGLYIEGESGLAKSSLGAYILKEALKKGEVCFYIRMSQLTRLLFEGNYKSEANGTHQEEVIHWIKEHVTLLMIDEIDKDFKINNPTSYNGSLVNDFFGYVYDHNKSLIVTSNKPKVNLKGIHADNIIDRLEELADVILVGNSFRSPNEALTKILG